MKLKTFLATYALFLTILFSSLGFVSIYMMNNQVGMLMKKGAAEYQTIAASLSKDISVLFGRTGDNYSGVDMLMAGYVKYYASHGIRLALTGRAPQGRKNKSNSETLDETWNAMQDESLNASQNESQNATISFVSEGEKHFVFVTGSLSEVVRNYRLDYYYDASRSISDTRDIQNYLLVVCIAVSVITAFALHFIIAYIFHPLGVVAKISRKIANGQYNERISVNVKGKNELTEMAMDFNRMAEEIEAQIRLLEEEAVNKQHFVDNFAHEIRTPLTSVYGYAEYMQKAKISEEEVIESAQYIMDEAVHMKKIANSLLELSTLRNYKPVKNRIFIPQLFEDINQTMKKGFAERKIRFIYRSEGLGDDDVLEGQEDLIKSMLLNLCANALDACSPGKGVILLEAEKQEKKIVLSVSDNGRGIPPESVSRVTEPFYRVDRARGGEAGGAGLGLALCKQIADAHGAKLVVESAAVSGTRELGTGRLDTVGLGTGELEVEESGTKISIEFTCS